MNLNFTLVIEIISFVLLLLILTKILYKPLLDFLDQRKDIIQESIDEAKRLKESAQHELQESNRILRESKDRALEIKNQTDIELEELKSKNIEQVKQEARRISQEAKEAVKKEVVEARRRLKNEVAEVSIEIAKKVLSREVDLKDHKRLINEAIEELEDG
jgi:F-type H+-transporting ATPase subunit b